MAKKADTLAELRKQIKENRLSPLYLFYGEEEYLKEYYTRKIAELVPDGGFPEFNHIFLNGVRPFSEYDDAWESFPMMTDKKLLVIKDSELMKSGRSGAGGAGTEAKKAFWGEKLKRIADDTVVIFSEKTADKRSTLYKALAKAGTVVEFDYLSDTDLVTWIIRECTKNKKKIDKSTAQYLAGRVDPGLNNMINELDKLFEFCDAQIYKSDIDRVVSKSLQVITFDLTDAVMANDAKKATEVLSDIKINSKESSFAILYLMLASFEKIYHAKLMSGRSVGEIASALGTAPFIARKYIDSARRFGADALERAVMRVAEIDLEIKEGKIDEWTALYQYVTECLYYQQKKA